MAAIVSIGAGPGQLPLILAAYELGFDVIAVDRNPASGCVPFIKESIIKSTFEIDGVLDGLEKRLNHFDIKAVLSRTSGPALITAARVAEHLDVPGVPVAFAEAAFAKSMLINDAAAEGISTPLGICCVSSVSPRFSLPWVIKPDAPLVGKKNVYLANDMQAFEVAFDAALSESQNMAVEVEEFLDGVDVGYMAVMIEGKVKFDLLYDEFVSFNDNRACGLGVGSPSIFSGTHIEEQARFVAKKLLSRWKVIGGFSFFSFRLTKNGIFLYEANPGLCGDAIADKLLPTTWPGFDAFRTEVLAVTGEAIEFPETDPQPCVVFNNEVAQCGAVEEKLNLLSGFPGGNEIIEKTRRLLS